MREIRFVILLIPIMGIAAGLVSSWGSMDPATRETLSGYGLEALGIAFALSVIVFAWRKVSRAFQSSRPSSYTAPVVTGARVGDGIGELEVAASHSIDVSKLILPRVHRVITIRANELYRVEFDSPKRSIVEEIARRNGYHGKVG